LAFESQHWRPRIDDPLPPALDVVPQQRLHQLVKNLNRALKPHSIRFYADGTGQGVCWQRVP
jgi:hypothetical protein